MASALLCCLLINEVAFAPSDAAAEFVELLNVGTSAFQATGLQIYDANMSPRNVSTRPITIPPGAFLVLVRDAGAFSRQFPGVPFLEVPSWPSLNNGGDRVGVSLGGVELDAVAYEGSWGTAGRSIERIDPRGPSWHQVNWASPGADHRGSPGQQNHVYAPDLEAPRLAFADRPHPDSVFVVFHEPVASPPTGAFAARSTRRIDDQTFVLAGALGPDISAVGVTDLFGNTAAHTTIPIAHRPTGGELIVSERLVRPLADPHDGVPDQPLFAELYNAGTRLLSLRSLVFSGRPDENGVTESTSTDGLFKALPPGGVAILASSVSLLAQAFVVPDCVLTVEIPRSLASQTELQIHSPAHLIDRAIHHRSWHDPARDDVGRSLSRIGGQGTKALSWASQHPSPGVHQPLPHRIPAGPGEIVITEVLFDARSDGIEFVELYALGTFDANGLWLRIDRTPAAPDSTRLVYESLSVVPGSFLVGVIPVSGVDARDLVAFANSRFPGAPAETTWRPLVGARSLRDTGVDIRLIRDDGVMLDHVSLTPDMHHPALADADGVSIHRRDPTGPSGELSNWSSSLAATGSSPGAGVAIETANASGGEFLTVQPPAFDPSNEHVAISVADGCDGTAMVQIYSRVGTPLRRMAAALAETAVVYWDGTDAAGRMVGPGIYIVYARTTCGRSGKAVVITARR